MKIALPVYDTATVYRDNPHTTPKFAIYDIDSVNNSIHYSLHSVVVNPLNRYKSQKFPESELLCSCSLERQNDLSHKCEHYSLLETISDCSYLLASKYCQNTKKSMKKAGIKVVKIPPIITQTNSAIINFIIGASLERNIQNIHHAS